MSHNEKSLFWICVILTMAMAFTALMISLPRIVDAANSTRLDYQGTIVTAFATLVTVLIGWQIYSALGIDRRVYKAEKRIANMLSQLQKAREKIDTTAQSSEDYSTGINFLSIAMIEYVQTINNRSLPIDIRVKHYCACYVISAGAIIDFINSGKEIALISTPVDLCVQGMTLSSKFLFDEKNISATRIEFTEDVHNKCEQYYKKIMENPLTLGADNVVKINEHRNNRVKLLKNQ